MLLSGPALYALALIMAAALVVPAVFSVDTNVRDFSVESYKNMQLRQLTHSLSPAHIRKIRTSTICCSARRMH